MEIPHFGDDHADHFTPADQTILDDLVKATQAVAAVTTSIPVNGHSPGRLGGDHSDEMLNLNPRLVVVFSLTLNVVVVIFACLYDGPSLLPTPGARLSSYDISPVFRLDSWKLGQNRESKAVTGVRDCSACAIAPRLCGEYG